MNKTKRCIKCNKKIIPKRKDAKQCVDCKRKQQDESSYKIKKEKRKMAALQKSFEKAKKTGAKEKIEEFLISTLESCLEDSKYPTEEEFKFLADQILYEFEISDLPKRIQDKYLQELRETKFRSIFDKINSSSN